MTVAETATRNAAESICGGGGGSDGGTVSLLLRQMYIWGGILLLQVEFDNF